MITIKTPEQIEKMRRSCANLYEVLQTVKAAVQPGATTKDLDQIAESEIRERGGIPSFLGYEGYPASVCASVNDVVVHGIPSKKHVLKEGDIVSLDCGMILNGWQSDSALTVPVGKVSEAASNLIARTEECFFAGARAAVNGNRLGDIGYAVESTAKQYGYGVIRDLCGHGIGREMHEDPEVYNFGRPGHGIPLRPGMTIAVEPMIAMGTWRVKVDKDGWTTRTADRSLASHYEHTLVIRENGLPELLTYPGFSWKEET